MRRALVAIVACALPAAAHADAVSVHVVEVAGGVAYIDVGRAAGIVRGTTIAFGTVELIVTEATETTAVIELGTVTLAVGATGTANVTPGAVAATHTRAAPRPAEAFVGQWPHAQVPSAQQRPATVPLGAGAPPGRAHVTVIGQGFAAASRDAVDAEAQGRIIASFDLLADRPLALDADVAARVYASGANSGARTPLFVRTVQLRYGDAYDPRFALGRLRYAAASLGMLDGARAAYRTGVFEVGAFGGLVPDPVSGKPSTDASRFGAEVAYDDPSVPWQPRVSLTAYGSTWTGSLDERRVTATASARKDALWLDAWTELQSFATDNPWGASAVEVTGAGATADYRRGGKHVAVDVTFLRPERSLRLAAALPPEWLCTRQPQPGAGLDEPCTGGDSWVSASVSAGARGERWSVDAIGAIGRTNGVVTSFDSSGYVSGELRFGTRRLLAGASAGRANFGSWTAGELGAGVVMSHSVALSARYRPELIDYVASTGATLLHSVVIDADYPMSSSLDAALSLVGSTGVDRDAAAALATLVWRPLP